MKRRACLYKNCSMVIFILVLLLLLSGCSLAKEDAGGEEQLNTDRLIGTFVTTEYLDLFNMEAYINDHADELLSGTASGNISDGEIINTMEYNGRIYGAVDKHGSTEPSDWEITFGDMEGVCFFDIKWQREGEESFNALICGEKEAVKNAVGIVVETIWADGEVTREFFELEESEHIYVETFYKTSDAALGKQSTEIYWK